MDVIATDFSTFLTEAVAGASSAFPQKPMEPGQQPLLNGLPYRLFRQSVALDERRRSGTFFSGADLSNRLAAMLRARLPENAVVMDPTCGIGDLLLAYAALLPLGPSLDETLEIWGNQLAGMDLRSELVSMTKTRLVMLARARGGFQTEVADLQALFPLIAVGDMLLEDERIAGADGYLFNPPFGRTSDHAIDTWATGKVNAAAIFLARLVSTRSAAAPIAAVLPEVLRCGSRYELFRRHLEANGLGGTFESLGRFDSWTDVDVFITLLSDDGLPAVWAADANIVAAVVGDRFESRVGPVVPHRHAEVGKWHRFVCAKTTPAWSPAFEPRSSRRFKGTVFKPPFVVVRRTSSPSDKQRAVGAIIVGEREVAVENHLIVLIPRDDGGLAACKELLEVLKHDATSDFLNEHIRCRHLTTGSVVAIPWVDTGA